MFPLNDGLDVILLGTFLFGLLFTVGSLLLGAADIGGHHGGGAGGDHGFDHGFHGHELMQLFNLSAILAFLTWFGGVGYVVRNGIGAHWSLSLMAAVAGGFLAAVVVTVFIRKVLRSGEETLDPHDYERVGVLAKVTSSIREGGVGEIVWEQRGSRMVTSARAATQEPIPRGTEVLILKVERGLAIVEPFDGLLRE